jgi:hypothetical protein
MQFLLSASSCFAGLYFGLMFVALSLHAGLAFSICMVCYKKKEKKKAKHQIITQLKDQQ